MVSASPPTARTLSAMAPNGVLIGGYWETVLRHYELAAGHLSKTKGYEYYGRLSEIAREKGGTDALTEFFLSLQIWGTPTQCLEKIHDVRSRMGADTFVGVFSYAGMPYEDAERNMRLFARSVMPELQALDADTRNAARA